MLLADFEEWKGDQVKNHFKHLDFRFQNSTTFNLMKFLLD